MSPILLLGGVSALLVLGLSSCNGAQGGNLVPVKKTSQPRAAIDHEAIIARDRVKFGFPREIRFHPKGEVIAVATEGMVEIRGGSSLKFLFPLAESEKKPERARSVDFSPDGKHLAVDYPFESDSWKRGVTIWDWKEKTVVKRFGEHKKDIYSLRYSPDGLSLATASSDNTVCVWSTQNGALIKKLEDYPSVVRHVAYSPDGQLLATHPFGFRDKSSREGFLRIWRTQGWEKVTDLVLADVEAFDGLTFSADGSRLYSTANHLIVWKVGSWECEFKWKPEARSYGYRSSALIASGDGRLLALGTSEGIVRLLRIQDFREVSVKVFPPGAAAHISGLHFSSDSKRLAVAGSNSCAIIDVEKAMR